MNRIAIFSGSAHRTLAAAICANMASMPMSSMAGIRLGEAKVGAFSDGETQVQILENVRGADCYVVQPTCAPTNHNVMELCVMVHALKLASAASVTAVVPYYGYARQDRKVAPRTPITSKLVADLLETAGMDRIVTVDLHAGQIQGFFNVPADNLFATPILLPYLQEHYAGAVVVSPDAGGVERARAYSKLFGGTLAIVDKRRDRPNESEVMNVIGDVEGRRCLVVDDMIDTAGTLVNAAKAIIARGAESVSAAATHGVCSGKAATTLRDSPLAEIVLTDTIPLPKDMETLLHHATWMPRMPKLTVRSSAPLIAEAIRGIHANESLSKLFVVEGLLAGGMRPAVDRPAAERPEPETHGRGSYPGEQVATCAGLADVGRQGG